jgi:hypothetical protein
MLHLGWIAVALFVVWRIAFFAIKSKRRRQ